MEPMFTPPDLDAPVSATLLDIVTPSPAKPSPAPRKRAGGRPKGAKTNPQKLAAARTRRAGPQAPGTPQAPASSTAPADDLAAASVAERVAAAAVPSDSSDGGRPTARQTQIRGLAAQLSTAYEGLGGIISVGALAIAGVNPAASARLAAVGQGLQDQADKCGLALARWADTNPRVRAWLANAATSSGFILVAAAHAPIIAAAFSPGAVPAVSFAATMLAADPDAPAGADPMADMMAGFMSAFVNTPQGHDGTAPA